PVITTPETRRRMFWIADSWIAATPRFVPAYGASRATLSDAFPAAWAVRFVPTSAFSVVIEGEVTDRAEAVGVLRSGERRHRHVGRRNHTEQAQDCRRHGTQRDLFRRAPVRVVGRANPQEPVRMVHPALDSISLVEEIEERAGTAGPCPQ